VLDHFRKEKFIDKVEAGVLHLAHDGFDPDINRVPLAHARWFAGLASQLSSSQLRRAFEAAGATAAEVDGYSATLRAKIAALRAAVHGRTSATPPP
jgi:hypothetical protein